MKILKLLVDMPDYNLKAGNLVLSYRMEDDMHCLVQLAGFKSIKISVLDAFEISYEDVISLLDYYNKL